MRGIALLYKNRGVKWMILDTFKGSKKVIGVKQATKAISKDIAERVFIASDAEPRVVKQLKELCAEKNTAIDCSITMAELAKACAIEVGAATVVITK